MRLILKDIPEHKKIDHTKCMDLPYSLTMCSENSSSWGFASQDALVGTRIACISPNFVSTQLFVLPGFAPAGEPEIICCVPKGVTLPLAKGPNNGHALRDISCTDAPSGLIGKDGRERKESGPTRSAHTRPTNE